MIYYHHEQKEKMLSNPCNKKLDAVLQKNFPEKDKWGACVYFDKNKIVDFVEINKLSEVTQHGAMWTHYATIGKYDDCTWELYSQFNGKKENELWVFKYYSRFADACRCVSTGAFRKLTPILKY